MGICKEAEINDFHLTPVQRHTENTVSVIEVKVAQPLPSNCDRLLACRWNTENLYHIQTEDSLTRHKMTTERYKMAKDRCKMTTETQKGHKEMQNKHRQMQNKYREMQNEYRDMQNGHKEMQNKHREMQNEYREMQNVYREMQNDHKTVSYSFRGCGVTNSSYL